MVALDNDSFQFNLLFLGPVQPYIINDVILTVHDIIRFGGGTDGKVEGEVVVTEERVNIIGTSWVEV